MTAEFPARCNGSSVRGWLLVGELIVKRNHFVFFLALLMKVSYLTVDSLERN